jgi:hypothetical protein
MLACFPFGVTRLATFLSLLLSSLVIGLLSFFL